MWSVKSTTQVHLLHHQFDHLPASSLRRTTMTDPLPPPSCRVLIRTKRDLELYSLASTSDVTTTRSAEVPKVIKLLEGCATTLQVVAKHGKWALVHITSHGVVKLDLERSVSVSSSSSSTTPPPPLPPLFLTNSSTVQMMHLSPRDNYVLTWERFHAETCPKNLKVWDVATGQFLVGFPQKNLSRDAWPYLQWTVDEQLAFLMANTQIRVYTKADIMTAAAAAVATHEPRFIDRLQVEGSNLSVPQDESGGSSPSSSTTLSSYFLTVFSAKSKNKPATTSIYEYSTGSSSSSSFQLKASKSLFQAEECVTHWNPRGNACLLSLQTAVDNSGQSYYGSSLLFLWNGIADDIIAVPLPQEGPVQAVAWSVKSPVSFLAIAGRMPAMASLHHGQTGAVTFLFGNNVHRNTIAMSPHGRFVCLAGFGNLAGGMGFWDVNKKKLLPHSVANATGHLQAESTVTSHGWSPDSRTFLVASTAPRMNVDNGVHLYKYTGEKIPDGQLPWKNERYRPNQLLEACFVPAPVDTYPDRPQSPPPEGADATAVAAAATTAEQLAAATAKPAVVARYVPPSARNRDGGGGGGSSLAERMRKEKEGQVIGATTVTAKVATTLAVKKSTIPGMAAPVAPAGAGSGKSKSQLKREKMKKQKEQEQQPPPPSKTAVQQLPPQPMSAKDAPAASATTSEVATADDAAKRARRIKKLLKQIDDLKEKMKQTSGSSSSLNDDQKAKLESEASLREELATLE